MSALDHPEHYGALVPVWLVTIAACGRVWRLSSEVCTVTSNDGDLLFEAGLDDLSVDEALGEPGGDPGEPVASIEQAHLDGVVTATTYGQDLTAGRGEVALWLPGTAWEDRRVLVAGRVRSAAVGRDDVCDLTLGDTLDVDHGRILDAAATIDAASWPSAQDSAVGAAYPVPFGLPGVYTATDGTSLTAPASPAPMVDTTGGAERLLIADGRVEAASVTIHNLDDGTSDFFAVVATTDGRSREVSRVSLAVPGALTVDANNSYAVIFDQGGGGVLSDRAERLAGAGDVAVYVLARSTLPIDYGAWQAARAALNAYTLAGYIDDPDASPMDWIIDNLLPLLPVSLVFGPLGLAPYVWPMQITATDAEMVIDATVHAGDLELDQDAPDQVGEFVPEVSIRYAFSLDGDAHRRRLTLTGNPTAITSALMAPTAQLRAIWLDHVARTGSEQPATQEVESDIVGDDLTAARVLGWRAEMTSRPRRRVRYRASWAWGWVRLGMIVSVTDTTLRLNEAVGIVDAITWSALGPSFVVRLQSDVARDLSAVG